MLQRHSWAPLALILTFSSPVWSAAYQNDRVVLPAGTVLKVTMDDTIGSNRSNRGDRFSATVEDRELPSGTRVEGVVTEVTRAREDRPGMMDVEFRTLRLPDGQQYQLVGTPTSLDSRSVQRTADGRLVSRSRSKDRSKFIAYGAGAGLIIGSLLGENIAGTLLGAAAGYLYGQQSKSKANGREVVVQPGTEFGVRLDRRLALAPTGDSRYRERVGGYRSSDRTTDRYRSTYSDRTTDRYRSSESGRATDRYRSDRGYAADERLTVFVNDRSVSWGTARPFRSGGRLMVPLAPVLEAGRFDYRYDRADREIVMDRPRDVTHTVGSDWAVIDGRRVRLSAPSRIIDGTLYVPSDFFRLAMNMQARWDQSRDTLHLSDDRYADDRYVP